MTAVSIPKNPIANWEQARDEWLGRLSGLVESVEAWAKDLGWSTRRVEKKMDDSQLGAYSAPGLLMQESTTRVLLEPIARFAPGVDGVVDLYLMPAYDDIATLYFYDGCWHLHYWFPGMPMAGDLWQTKGKPLSKESVMEVLDEMRKNAA